MPTRIVVTDDGIGMDIETVLGAWLEPGTVIKKRAERSPGGRLYQGAKGIGRFAAARLGDSLLLETKKQGENEVVLVLLHWGAFTDDSYLEDIEVEYEVKPAPHTPDGTRLTIEGIKPNSWQSDSFERLHARLSRLISPFEDIKDFDIELQIPAHPDLSGSVQPPDLLLKPRYQLRGQLDSRGNFRGTIRADNDERNVDRHIGGPDEVPECGPLEIELRAWDRDREGLEPIATREQMAISQIRKTLNTYCGVSIYRDGFRVHPYGEKGDDWLNLDLRSRQNPVRNLANNQIIAAIRISRENNPELRDRSTREGMVKNASHHALEEWFRRIITVLEEERYKTRPRKETRTRTEPIFEAFDLAEAVKEARRSLGADHPLTQMIEESEKQITQGVDQVQEVFSRLLMSAGLGHMVDIVIHEIGAPLGKTNRQLVILERQLRKTLGDKDIGGVMSSMDSIRGWLEQIHNLRQRLDPQTAGRRGRATTFEVIDEVKLTFELYSAIIQKQKIHIKTPSPKKSIRAKMSKAVLAQVLANLVDNAIYWIVREHGSGKGGSVRVDLRELSHGFSVTISDDGRGVPEEDQETIFEPYYSTKPNGIGLGLYIARLLMEPYGRLIYKRKGKLSGACFEARFERGVGL